MREIVREIVLRELPRDFENVPRDFENVPRDLPRDFEHVPREFREFSCKKRQAQTMVNLRGGSPFFSREIFFPENPRENFENPRDNPREILPRVIARFPRDFCWGVISRRILSTKLWGEALSGTCAPPDCLRRYTTWLCLGSAGICGPGLVYLVCPH